MKKIYAAVSPDVSRREIENRNRSRLIAAEGMVLLENNGILPLKLKEAKNRFVWKWCQTYRLRWNWLRRSECKRSQFCRTRAGARRCCHYHESVAGQIRCCGSAEERSL